MGDTSRVSIRTRSPKCQTEIGAAIVGDIDTTVYRKYFGHPPAKSGGSSQYAPGSQEEMNMPRVIITHDVVDLQRWLDGKAERAAAISAIGGSLVDTVALDGSSKVAVAADISDLAALEAMLTAPPPELAALMEKHGVIPPFTAYVEK
jgi:hypothetical protein